MPDYFVDTCIIYEQLKAATIYPIVSQISVGVTIPLCSLTEFSINVGKFSERNIFRIVFMTNARPFIIVVRHTVTTLHVRCEV